MTPTLLLLFGVVLPASPVCGGHLLRMQVAAHNVLMNSSQAEKLNSSTTKLGNTTKNGSAGLPGPFDPQEERYQSGLRLQPHDFQTAVYLFKTMDKDRNQELTAAEFSKGLSEVAPSAVEEGKYLWHPLACTTLIMKPPQFYRFFALAMTNPAQYAWQRGERAQLTEYFQDEKAKLLRLFITYDVDSNDGISKSELEQGFNNTLLRTVRQAKIPVADLFATEREMRFALPDFAKFARSSSDGFLGLLNLVEFVELGNEANRKAYMESGSHQPFGCFGAFSLLLMMLLIQ
jgi:hypothetical protein